MIIVDCEQGDETWDKARAGIPTASGMNKIYTSGGKKSTQATDYRDTLLMEWLLGGPTEDFKNHWMERGNDLEDEARTFYEFQCNTDITTVGFCYADEERLHGASPDGLVGEEGLLEIKCPKANTHMRYILAGKAPTGYFVQMQGQMLVTGRKWVDFVSHFPGLEKPIIIRVERDERFLMGLSSALRTFIADMLVQRKKLIALGYHPLGGDNGKTDNTD